MKRVESLKTGSEFKQTPIGMIPVDWEIRILGELTSISSGESCKYSKDFFESYYPVYGSNGIMGYFDKFNFSDGFVIGRVGASGSINQINERVWATDNTLLIEVNSNKVEKRFLYYFLIKSELSKFATKTAQPLLTQTTLKSVTIVLPPLIEQKKIAEILSTVDHTIQKTDQIIQKTTQLKKALMQQLLTKGIGHRDFRKTEIGEIPKEWKVKPLKDLAKIDRGKFQHRPRNEPRFYGGSYPFIQTGEVTNSGGRIRKYSQTLNEAGLAISKLFPKGTILITIAANIGETAIADFDVAFPDSLIGIIANDEVDNRFLEYYLRMRKEHLISLATESAQKNINLETLRPYPIIVPPKKEQIQIVCLLEKIEENEFNEKTILGKLRVLKGSLMTILLTGKIRTN